MLLNVTARFGVGPVTSLNFSSQLAPNTAIVAMIAKALAFRIVVTLLSQEGSLRRGVNDERATHVFMALTAFLGAHDGKSTGRVRHEVNGHGFATARDEFIHSELLDLETVHAIVRLHDQSDVIADGDFDGGRNELESPSRDLYDFGRGCRGGGLPGRH